MKINTVQEYDKTIQFIENHIDSDVVALALQKGKYPDIDFSWALKQIAARQKNREKFPTLSQNLHFLFPANISVEQSSSEITARFKSSILSGKKLLDFTAGFGIDSLFFTQSFKKVVAIEPQQELCDLLANNARLLEIQNIEVKNDTAENVFSSLNKEARESCTFYIDPSRRDEKGERVTSLKNYQPDLDFLKQLVTFPNSETLIKLSPMLDISELKREIPNIQKIYIVAVQNECKELLLHCASEKNNAITEIQAVNLLNDRVDAYTSSFEAELKVCKKYVQALGDYIYEPNVALLKAGAYFSIADHFNIEKLDLHTHLYTSNDLLPHFFGKVFKVKEVLNCDKQGMAKVKGKPFQLICKNFPTQIENLRKQLKIKDKGEDCLIVTAVNGKNQLIICEKPRYY